MNEWFADHVSKREPLIVNKAIQYTGNKFLYFDVNKAVTELGYHVTPSEVALKETVAWFKAGREERLALESPPLL